MTKRNALTSANQTAGASLEQRVSLITLGVSDLERARDFYEGALGWKAAPSPPGIVFFDLGGVVFSLYPHAELAADMKAAGAPAAGYRGFALAHNLRSIKDVDAFFERLRQAGVTIDKAPEQAPWGGYSGYFSDPDGHKWEVAFNPFWTILPSGRILLAPSRQVPDRAEEEGF